MSVTNVEPHVFDRVGSALARAVRQRLAERAEREAGVLPLEQTLARGERSVEDWLTDLSGLGAPSADAGYRAVPVDKEALWRIVEDPSAAETARAGAAVVLRRGLEPGEAARVRVVVEACAAPKLRVALEAALAPSEEEEGDDERREALAALEEER